MVGQTPRFLRRNRTVILFVVGLAALDLSVGRFRDVWDRFSPDDYTARVEGCRERPRDFVLVGGSPVSEGLDPAVLAGCRWNGGELRDGYALGLPGGTTSEFYHAVAHACPAPPRLLVYGVTASDLNDGRREPHGPYSLMTAADVAEWARLRPEAGEWAARHYLRGRLERASNLYRYRDGVRLWAAGRADALLPGCCPETRKAGDEQRGHADGLVSGHGYSPAKGFERARFTDFKAAGATGTRFDSLYYLDGFRTGAHLKYLHRLADWCQARGTTLVLLDMPVTADLERLYAKEFAEYRGRLAAVERGRGLRVLRPSREAVGLCDDQFADLIHLNRDGAGRLSRWLRETLADGPPPGSDDAPGLTARAAAPAAEGGPRP